MRLRDVFSEKWWRSLPETVDTWNMHMSDMYPLAVLLGTSDPDHPHPLPPLTRDSAFSVGDALCMARLSAAVYESNTEKLRVALLSLGFRHIAFYDRHDVACFMCKQGDVVVGCFRGSQVCTADPEMFSSRNWATDLCMELGDGGEIGTVHRGFNRALDEVYDRVHEYITTNVTTGCTLYLTGHSMGGALATLTLARITDKSSRVVNPDNCILYTIGCPRCGGEDFATRLSNNVTGLHRLQYVNDVFCRTPMESQGYCHVPADGTVTYLDETGMHSQVPRGLFADTMVTSTLFDFVRWTWTLDDWILFSATLNVTLKSHRFNSYVTALQQVWDKGESERMAERGDRDAVVGSREGETIPAQEHEEGAGVGIGGLEENTAEE
ncbi:hypothetical protein KIPB_005092 [Kipferlia bialata]|uniref:Fungal lipase-type domain-containing protein n=1 Tax=Kipferlia bialata TaxID=797122 RepID=A0A9K3GIN4_9EUKA|nr:hypothetical protein KIPB_005092 [Kipferlia bialata]|eukprot:g5092.t1